MTPRPPRPTRTDTLFPYPTRFRSAHVLARQTVPDRQQEPCDDVELAHRELRDLADLPLPKRSKPVVERRFPVRGREIADAHGLPAHRADQAHALLDAAVVVHAAGRGDAHGGAVGEDRKSTRLNSSH